MGVALACTWRPRRDDVPRLHRLQAEFEAVYQAIVIALPPTGDLTAAEPLRAWPTVQLLEAPQVGWGRSLALRACLETSATHLHYADLDGLLAWIERRPDEWRTIVTQLQTVDCLIVGRSERAFATRPMAIQQTERIINAVAGHLLGRAIDCGLGERGFSRRAAELVLCHTAPPGWFDVAWPLLVQRAGLNVTEQVVDGVDWETTTDLVTGWVMIRRPALGVPVHAAQTIIQKRCWRHDHSSEEAAGIRFVRWPPRLRIEYPVQNRAVPRLVVRSIT
jgi:hypothetical protein